MACSTLCGGTARTELFARYGATALIGGFGSQADQPAYHRTSGLSGRTYSEMYQLICLTVILPVLVLLVVAVRGGAEQRDRRLAMLDALGAPRRAKGWVLVGEANLPIAIGGTLASAAAFITTFVDVTIPVVGYRVWSTDLAPRRFAIVLLALGAIGRSSPPCSPRSCGSGGRRRPGRV
jgi:hypothetical protein